MSDNNACWWPLINPAGATRVNTRRQIKSTGGSQKSTRPTRQAWLHGFRMVAHGSFLDAFARALSLMEPNAPNAETHLHRPQSLLKDDVLSDLGMGKSSEMSAPLSSSTGAFLRLAVLPVARIFHTIEGPTRRRVRAPGLQVPTGRCCRPGALTRCSGREISRIVA